MNRIEGKVAVVTGAGAGIGRAVVQRFAREGAIVIALDINRDVLSLTEEFPNVEARLCDVSDSEQVRELFAHCRERHGQLDILMNNAGIGIKDCPRLHEMSLEQWDRVMDVNQRGAFIVMKHALPLMIDSGGGSLINTASVGALVATRNASAYLSSKGGMLMLTRAAALEYRDDNIRVNAICPGMTRTSIFDGITENRMEALLARSPARMIEPEEVASLALFLASDEACAITGATYVIDAGRTAGA